MPKKVPSRKFIGKIFVNLIFFLFSKIICAGEFSPCTGDNSLLSLIDRPSFSYSACVTPAKEMLLESGYVYAKLPEIGHGQLLPQAEYRLGIGFQSEFDILTPNYVEQTHPQQSGFSSTTLLFKKEIFHSFKEVLSFQLAINPPGGSETFGSKHNQYFGNLLYNYNFENNLGVSLMLGPGHYTQTNSNQVQGYTSFNGSIVLSYPFKPKLTGYFEAYSQTKTSPNSKWASNMDTGFIYLMTPNISLDIEYGQRLSGQSNGFENYLGFGGVIRFV